MVSFYLKIYKDIGLKCLSKPIGLNFGVFQLIEIQQCLRLSLTLLYREKKLSKDLDPL